MGSDDDVVVRKALETLFSRIKTKIDVDREELHRVKDALLQSTRELKDLYAHVVKDQVKKILEQVYGDIKNSVDDRALLGQLKECIIDSKEEVTKIVKRHLIVVESSSSSSSSSAAAAAATTASVTGKNKGNSEDGVQKEERLQQQISTSTASQSHYSTLPLSNLSANRTKTYYRPKILMVTTLTSHHITSHQITSHHITSHHITNLL